MDDDWYLLEFSLHTPDGHVHERAEWRQGRSEAYIHFIHQVAMGEWDTWHMELRPHPRQTPTRYALASGRWFPMPWVAKAPKEEAPCPTK
jgi:hypothetical protein